jgi:predicted metal-dependent phosphoesterase TrpH
MLKVELHAHTDQDPADAIPHSTPQLIDHAAALGYGALAVTLHDRYFDPGEWRPYAQRQGLVLLSGIERTIQRQHVLLINFPPACATVTSFEQLARLKAASGGLVIAPHPFYPTISALRGSLDAHGPLFDAIEINAMYTRWLNFNRAAARWARAHAKPLVGNTDLHVLEQMGTTYSLVDAAAAPDAICEAIRAGRVEVRSTPLTSIRAAWLFGRMLAGGARGRAHRWLGSGGRDDR